MNAQKYVELKQQRDALASQLKVAAKAVLEEMAKDVFAAHPILASFGWRQYTPYFNDGEPCVFSAQTEYPDIKFTSRPDAEDNEFYDKRKYAKPVEAFPSTPEDVAGCAVVDMLGVFDEAELLALFGDHQRVTVDRAGVTVEEYEHD